MKKLARDQKVALLNAKRDQAWKYLEEDVRDIERILATGPSNLKDIRLVEGCLALVIGEILSRKIEREETKV